MDLGLTGRVVVIAAADPQEGAACARLLTDEGATVVSADQLADTATAVGRAIAAHGRVDAVVACTPRPRATTITDVDDPAALYEVWGWVESIVEGYLAALPGMMERGWGRLVSVMTNSVKWLDDGSDELGALAGWGILGMHKAAVADVARSGVATNAVLRDGEATAEDVANVVAFLVSEGAGYLQGVTMSLDGASSPAVF